MMTAKPSRTQRANRNPKNNKASAKCAGALPCKSKDQIQRERLAKIREAAFRQGERMAARALAKREGFAAGVKAAQKKSR